MLSIMGEETGAFFNLLIRVERAEIKDIQSQVPTKNIRVSIHRSSASSGPARIEDIS
jgi:hypothetical protein